jgi:hypothetical protein
MLIRQLYEGLLIEVMLMTKKEKRVERVSRALSVKVAISRKRSEIRGK